VLATPELFQDRRHLAGALGRDQQGDGPAHGLGRRVAVDLLRPPVPGEDDAVQVLAEDGVRGRLDDGGQPRPYPLRPLALADVRDGAEHEQAIRHFDRREADLHRELAAVPAPAVQFAPASHGPHCWVGEEAGAVRRVSVPEAVRHQHFHRLPQQLAATVAEHPLGLGVHQDDPAVAVDHQHAAGGGLHHQAEALLRPLALADVAGDAEHADDVSSRVPVRHFGGKVRARDAGGGADVLIGLGLPGRHDAAFGPHDRPRRLG
jgi:hypothetical protein